MTGSFRTVLGVARQSVRESVRNRFVVAMLALLCVILLVLPRVMRGDGTTEGMVRVLLTWTVGLASVVIGAATLWAGCCAVSGDIEDGVYATVGTSASRPFWLWLGKWLGLVAVNGALLALTLAAVAAQARWHGIPPEALRPFERVLPDAEYQRVQAGRRVAEMEAEGAVFPEEFGTTREERVEAMFADLREGAFSLAPGKSFLWRFRAPDGVSARDGEPWEARIRFVSPYGTMSDVEGRISARFGGEGEDVASVDLRPDGSREARVSFPSPPEGIPGGWVYVRFENTGAESAPAALIEAAEGAVVRIPAGTFAGNLAKTGLILLAALATLAAVGTSAGAMLSRPVAIFAATGVVALGVVSHTDIDALRGEDEHTHVEVTAAARKAEAASRAVLGVVAVATSPVKRAAPLDRLGDGVRVSGKDVARCAAQNGVVVPAVFGLVAAAVLKRREIK